MVLVAISLTVLLGIAALAIDTGNFRAHRRQLQSAADAGALAGAAQLIANPGAACGAGGRADYYERRNSDLTDSHNLIKNANLDTSYCEIVNNSVRVKPVENGVPYVFGKVLGFLNTDIEARARARIVYLTTARGMMPIGVEDLRPQTVQVIRDDTGGVVASLTSGCGSSPEGFLYYCGGGTVNNLPAGGVPVHVRVTDVTGTVIDFANDGSGNPIGVGWIGTEDVPKSGATSCACTVKEVYVTQGIADPSLYYPFATTARSFGVNVHLTNVPNNAQVRVQLNGGPGQGAQASLTSGTNADGQWSTGASAFSTATSEGPENVTVTVKQGNTTYTSHTVQRIYPHDQSTLLYSYTQSGAAFGGRFVSSSLAAGAPGRTVSFQTAFVTLVKGREIVLKLGGGNAASPGNFGALDLDTNTSWAAVPVLRDERHTELRRRASARRLYPLLDRSAGADADRQSDRADRWWQRRADKADRQLAEPLDDHGQSAARRRSPVGERDPGRATVDRGAQRQLDDPCGRIRQLLHHRI